MAQLQRLLLLEIGGAEDRDRGAVAKPGEAIELTAQQPAPATEILRSEILDVEIDLAGGPDDRHLADHFSRPRLGRPKRQRSEEHTSELQSLMRISYAVFCLKKNKKRHTDAT